MCYNGATFKKTLSETVDGTMSSKVSPFFSFDADIFFSMFRLTYVHTVSFFLFFPQTINDITELYMKHSAGYNESASESAQNIIVDVIGCFYQRAQHDKRSSGSDVDDKSRNADGNNDHIPNIQEDTGCENDGSVPTGEELPADNAHDDDDANGNRETLAARDDGSGNTVIIPRSSGDCSSAPQSITETVKVSDQFDSSQSNVSTFLNILFFSLC